MRLSELVNSETTEEDTTMAIDLDEERQRIIDLREALEAIQPSDFESVFGHAEGAVSEQQEMATLFEEKILSNSVMSIGHRAIFAETDGLATAFQYTILELWDILTQQKGAFSIEDLPDIYKEELADLPLEVCESFFEGFCTGIKHSFMEALMALHELAVSPESSEEANLSDWAMEMQLHLTALLEEKMAYTSTDYMNQLSETEELYQDRIAPLVE